VGIVIVVVLAFRGCGSDRGRAHVRGHFWNLPCCHIKEGDDRKTRTTIVRTQWGSEDYRISPGRVSKAYACRNRTTKFRHDAQASSFGEFSIEIAGA
jgi:hypothetical protein